MNHETLHIDDLLSQRFDGFEPALPALAWEGIEARLYAPAQRRKGFFWWTTAAVVLVLATGGYGALKMFQSARQQHQISANSQQNSQSETSGTQKAGNKVDEPANNTAPENQAPASNSPAQNQVSGNAATSHSYIHPSTSRVNPELTPETAGVGASVTQTENNFRNLAENEFQGIDAINIEDPAWLDKIAASAEGAKLPSSIVEPKQRINRHLLVGLGVGQAVSNTGYSINNDLADYVNPYFKREMAAGEGLLASLNFSGAVYYQPVADKKLFISSGVNYYQRKNSLNFNFGRITPLEDATRPTDKFGNYPFLPFSGGKPFDTIRYKGTNTYTQLEIPVSLMFDQSFGYRSKWSVMPALGFQLGFITQTLGKTLDYHNLDVVNLNPTWFRTTYGGMHLNLGLYRNFSSKMKFGINAGGSYMLTPVYNSDLPVRPRALTGGLSTQLIWRLD